MNDLNIISILYIAFRLAPFILVSFFTLSSIFNQNIKGFIYLGGLLFATFVSVILSNTNSNWFTPSQIDNQGTSPENLVCNLMTLTTTGPISKIPLSLVVFSYTFSYLLYVIVTSKLVSQNIPTLIIFPSLIIGDALWGTQNKCTTWTAVLVATLIGGGIGTGWSALIYNLGSSKLQYYTGISNRETCSRPAKQKFRCVGKKL